MKRAFGILLLVIFFAALSCCSKKETSKRGDIKFIDTIGVELSEELELEEEEFEVARKEYELVESVGEDRSGSSGVGVAPREESVMSEEPVFFIQRQETQSTESEPDLEKKKTVEGKLQIVAPKEVEWGDDFVVIVKIAKDTIITEVYREEVQIMNKKVPITPKMSVGLTCYPINSIEIHPVNNGEQIIEDSGETSWRWNCKAHKTGAIELHVIISKVFEDGKKEMLQKETLVVKSNPMKMIGHFFSSNYQWLFSTLIIPVFLWVRSRRRRKDERDRVT